MGLSGDTFFETCMAIVATNFVVVVTGIVVNDWQLRRFRRHMDRQFDALLRSIDRTLETPRRTIKNLNT